MHNALLMHVLQSTSDLVDVLPDLALLKVNVLLDRLLDQQLQVALLRPLHRNEQLVELVVDEPIQVLDDVWVV